MSRTLKDRPDWVKLNDKSLSRIAQHDHENAGKPIYRSVKVEDENGEPVMESYTYYGVVGYHIHRPYDGYITYPTWEELLADNPNNEDIARTANFHYHTYYYRSTPTSYFYRMMGDVEATRVKRETALIGYTPTECTIDEYVPRPDKWYSNEETILCDHKLPYWDGGYYNCRNHFPTTEDRANYHRSSRSGERDALRKIAHAANVGYDLEEDDMLYGDVFEKRTQNRRGWFC